ncbi:MAG: hypothetical protein HKN74_03385 [Acidimicrobiia bacterium]|nr:hypothetical protein [Acidimicrobiia bacterium]NNL69824.1 hypothetical protein [Acidimicrobiia bacterium]
MIDADNRGVYEPGTIVTSSGGAALAFEAVEAGTHTLRVDIHFERLLIGNRDRGYGTWSVTTTAEDCS